MIFPNQMPNKYDNTAAVRKRISVRGARAANNVLTGVGQAKKERPKSKRKNPQVQLKYCCHNGKSKPKSDWANC